MTQPDLTPAEIALLNEQTYHGETAPRSVGPHTLAPLTFRRRRLLGRCYDYLRKNSASELEYLYGYIALMCLPEDSLNASMRSEDAWFSALDGWFEKHYPGGIPAADLEQARIVFDDDIRRITAATVDIVPRDPSLKDATSPNT